MDFGEQKSSEVLTAVFRVVNSQPHEIQCGEVMKGCSCAEATIEPRVIQAGEFATMKATWKLQGKRGRSSENLIVPYNGGGAHGTIIARMSATIQGVINPDQEVLELTTTRREGTLNYNSKAGRDFRLTGLSVSHGSIQADIEPGNRSVRVLFNPNVTGWQAGQIILTAHTDQPDEPEIRVWIRVTEPKPSLGEK
jgi:hypothetical protein